MKVIPLSEAKANLSRYGHLCHDEPVVVTVNGVPAFQLVPVQGDEDIVDRLIEHNPKFRQLLEKRVGEREVSIKSALRRL
jgi:antitoxin (DNA-binding transcriptional repressor) of toxin-antitoxin stability system